MDTRSDPGDTIQTRRRRSMASPAPGARDDTSERRRSNPPHRKDADGSDIVGVGDEDEDGVGGVPRRFLNGKITKLHNVRAEPIRDAVVVGYLVATKEVSSFPGRQNARGVES